MKTAVGIFDSQSKARLTVERLLAIGMRNDRISLLSPASGYLGVADIPTTETEQSGTGQALGSVVGGALGAAGGMSVGAAIASLVVPQVGAVLAIGLAAGALLGVAGAVGGGKVGEALEGSMARGLPIDERFVYEDALKKGRTIVIAFPDDPQSEQVRETMLDAGAESVDAARDNWWVGLQDDQRSVYSVPKVDSKRDETAYRHGLEAALSPVVGRKSYDEAFFDLREKYPDEYADESFARGYQQGYSYYSGVLAGK